MANANVSYSFVLYLILEDYGSRGNKQIERGDPIGLGLFYFLAEKLGTEITSLKGGLRYNVIQSTAFLFHSFSLLARVSRDLFPAVTMFFFSV